MRNVAVELAWALKLSARAAVHAERMKNIVNSLTDQANAVVAVCGACAGPGARTAGPALCCNMGGVRTVSQTAWATMTAPTRRSTRASCAKTSSSTSRPARPSRRPFSSTPSFRCVFGAPSRPVPSFVSPCAFFHLTLRLLASLPAPSCVSPCAFLRLSLRLPASFPCAFFRLALRFRASHPALSHFRPAASDVGPRALCDQDGALDAAARGVGVRQRRDGARPSDRHPPARGLPRRAHPQRSHCHPALAYVGPAACVSPCNFF